MDTGTTPATDGQANEITREAYLKRMESDGMEWDAKLATWGPKMDKGSADGKAGYYKWRRDFSEKRAGALRKMDSLRGITGDAWKQARAGMEETWNEVAGTFAKGANLYR